MSNNHAYILGDDESFDVVTIQLATVPKLEFDTDSSVEYESLARLVIHNGTKDSDIGWMLSNTLRRLSDEYAQAAENLAASGK